MISGKLALGELVFDKDRRVEVFRLLSPPVSNSFLIIGGNFTLLLKSN